MSQSTRTREKRRDAPGGGDPSVRVAADAAERKRRQQPARRSELVVGGRPRVDLLPTEVLSERRAQRVVERLWAGVVLTAVAAVVVSGAAMLVATRAGDDLRAAQDETLTLLQQQSQYREVRDAESGTARLKAAQSVGGSTEIAWGRYLATMGSSLPTGVRIAGVAIDSASPLEPYAQAESPLQGARVATITIDARSTDLPSVPVWLDSVKTLGGFVDATVNSVSRDESSGTYTVNMTMHVDEAAYDGRYAAKKDG